MKESALSVVRSVFGLACWLARWDCRAGLDMNFGTPRLEVLEPSERRPAGNLGYARRYMRSVWLRGTHSLAITPLCWRLEIADGTVARDTSRGKLASMAVARLNGEKLEGLTIDARTGATTLYFDLGAKMVIRAARDHSAGIELWSLSNSSRVVEICPHGLYRFGSVRATLNAGHEQRISTQSRTMLVLARTEKFARILRENSA